MTIKVTIVTLILGGLAASVVDAHRRAFGTLAMVASESVSFASRCSAISLPT